MTSDYSYPSSPYGMEQVWWYICTPALNSAHLYVGSGAGDALIDVSYAMAEFRILCSLASAANIRNQRQPTSLILFASVIALLNFYFYLICRYGRALTWSSSRAVPRFCWFPWSPATVHRQLCGDGKYKQFQSTHSNTEAILSLIPSRMVAVLFQRDRHQYIALDQVVSEPQLSNDSSSEIPVLGM